jgi:ABC-type transport system substrate-binding protein
MRAAAAPEAPPLFTLHYLYNTASKFELDLGTVLKNAWAKIGVELVLEGFDRATVSSRIWGNKGFPTFPTHEEGGFDVHPQQYNWIPTDLVYYIGCFNTEGIPPLGWNYWAAHDGRADELLREAMRTYNQTERLNYIFEWQDQKQREVNEIMLAYPKRAYLTDAHIRGYFIRFNCYDIDEWYWLGKTNEDHVTIKFAMMEDPLCLLPLFGDGGYFAYLPNNRMLFRLAFDGEKFSVEPELVTDWEIAEDGMSITLHLRTDVKWQDGENFTSADVKWTFEAILDKATGSTYYGDFSAAIKSVEAPDNYTVILHFKKPTPEILTLLAPPGGYCAILPEHVLGGIPHDQLKTSTYNTQAPPPGLGPMKFVEWKKGEYVKFEAWDGYFKGRVFVDEFYEVIIPEAATALAALEAHSVDMLATHYSDLLTGEFKRLQETKPDINATLAPHPATWFIALNNDHPVLQNKYVRQALAWATPYDTIINDLFYGYAEQANSQIHKSSWAWNPNTMYYAYDLNKARECLAKAGYPKWPPEPTIIPMETYLLPAVGGIIAGIAIGTVTMYLVIKKRRLTA